VNNREFSNTGVAIFKIRLYTLHHNLHVLLQINGHGMKTRQKKIIFHLIKSKKRETRKKLILKCAARGGPLEGVYCSISANDKIKSLLLKFKDFVINADSWQD
jgi:hypothetical protein